MQELNLPIAWRPDDGMIEQANITAQMRRYGLPTYEAFLQKSMTTPTGSGGRFSRTSASTGMCPTRRR
jgi:hypothetical protein